MNFRELKENSLTNKAFRELFQAISKKPYINEETLVSEEAEKLLDSYQFIYKHTRDREYATRSFYIKKCIVPYKSFDETVKVIQRIYDKLQDFSIDTLISVLKREEALSKGIKYSTFLDAVSFLNLK